MKMLKGQIFYQKPNDFHPTIEVSAIYVSVKGKLLWLRQSDLKTKTEVWEPPCGKIQQDETPLEAAKRELFEETGLNISLEKFQAFSKLYIRKSLDFIYHIFSVQLDTFPLITLSSEHTLHRWVSKEEAKVLLHLECGLEALAFYYFNIEACNEFHP